MPSPTWFRSQRRARDSAFSPSCRRRLRRSFRDGAAPDRGAARAGDVGAACGLCRRGVVSVAHRLRTTQGQVHRGGAHRRRVAPLAGRSGAIGQRAQRKDGARLAELEAGFTIVKAKVEAMKARLFARLRERWMASLRRAMPRSPQARFLKGALRAERHHPPGERAAGAGICGDGGGGGEEGSHR